MSEVKTELPSVIALHLCANNDVNGNPRRCFVVLDERGRHIETLDEDYVGEAALSDRWPMFSHIALREYLGQSIDAFDYLQCRYPCRVDVSVSEYRRFMRREPNSECQDLREWADAYQSRDADTIRPMGCNA